MSDKKCGVNVVSFPRELLYEQLELPYENYIEKNLYDSTRWSLVYEIIFEYEGKTYKTYYTRGATEMQEEAPWEYQDEVECTEVQQVEVKVKKWVPVLKDEPSDEGEKN